MPRLPYTRFSRGNWTDWIRCGITGGCPNAASASRESDQNPELLEVVTAAITGRLCDLLSHLLPSKRRGDEAGRAELPNDTVCSDGWSFSCSSVRLDDQLIHKDPLPDQIRTLQGTVPAFHGACGPDHGNSVDPSPSESLWLQALRICPKL